MHQLLLGRQWQHAQCPVERGLHGRGTLESLASAICKEVVQIYVPCLKSSREEDKEVTFSLIPRQRQS